MAKTKDKVTDDAPAAVPDAEEPAGRVEFDSRGNSVWRWAREVLDNTSTLLKRLDNTDLSLEPTRQVRIIGGPGKSRKSPGNGPAKPGGRDNGGGFDPYNS